jgi:hypothetical protein
MAMPKRFERGVDLRGRGAVEHQKLGLALVAQQHPVAHEAVAIARRRPEPCPSVSRARPRASSVWGRRLRAAHDLEQLHRVGRAEEVHAQRPLRMRRGEAIASTSSVEVLVASIVSGGTAGRGVRRFRA